MKQFICIISILFLLAGCSPEDHRENPTVNARDFGVLPSNSGTQNSKNLQTLIDDLTSTGGTVYIPEGEYVFAENGSQTIGTHCIKLRSNVSIVGDGEKTVLKPTGASKNGMDMFYFNDYLDSGKPAYLENCRFENFVINASETSCEIYTSAGKGFMINLFRNCHWHNVTVMYTDATGFGMDCPIDSTITNCTAVGCGKAATHNDPGASGFGIGYGYATGECITISNCKAVGNKKYGFFFEHQGRFDPVRYPLSNQGDFWVTQSTAEGNLYNFGGILAENVRYSGCLSGYAQKMDVYFEECNNCTFNGE